MRSRIFKSMIFLTLSVVLLSSILTAGFMYRELYKRMVQEIQNQTLYISTGYNISGEDYITNLKDEEGTNRITWISANGTVLFDNKAKPANMENHLDRPEVAAAFKNGYGEAVHLSKTLGKETFYYAVLLNDGTVIRISATIDSFYRTIFGFIPYILLIFIFVFIPTLYFVRYTTKRIVTPINNLNLENPLSNVVYDELSPLLSRMHKQNQHIEKQIVELKERQDEFTAITENMREGLILLNIKGQILSINKSAIKIFNIKSFDNTYKHLLTLSRSIPLQRAVNEAINGISFEDTLSAGNKEYNILANPVFEAGIVKGVILLILDITEKLEAEKIRREFSANVSHELKTPLTSISGYAEMLKNGMARNSDIPIFSERIFNEATHLIILINDIIKISRLDEKDTKLVPESIELLSLSQEIVQRLKDQAGKKGVKLSVNGDEAIISGVRHIIDEMIYNLCDNAIKYNRIDGSVNVNVSKIDDKTILTVSDNGIGIPKEHQARIFERFYRVDKSHSRDTGGTGLGLSIVKHGAEFHNAQIKLDSKLGSGTKISIIFDNKKFEP